MRVEGSFYKERAYAVIYAPNLQLYKVQNLRHHLGEVWSGRGRTAQ